MTRRLRHRQIRTVASAASATASATAPATKGPVASPGHGSAERSKIVSRGGAKRIKVGLPGEFAHAARRPGSRPAARTASQRAIVLRLSRPEMSGCMPVSRAWSKPPIVPANASGNQVSGHRGRCQAPRRGSSSSRSCWAPGPASRASRSRRAPGPRSPRIASARSMLDPAPSRDGPDQTSSQPDARAPFSYSRMYRLIPSSWGNRVRGSGRVLASTRVGSPSQ